MGIKNCKIYLKNEKFTIGSPAYLYRANPGLFDWIDKKTQGYCSVRLISILCLDDARYLLFSADTRSIKNYPTSFGYNFLFLGDNRNATGG